MNEFYESKRKRADKILLLAILVLALAGAFFITIFRGKIKLSEPIKLNLSGFSVSVPQGNGWRSNTNWIFNGDRFILNSFWTAGSSLAGAKAKCVYYLTDPNITATEIYEQMAKTLGRKIYSKGTIEKENFKVEWAEIMNASTGVGEILGLGRLPNNRYAGFNVSYNSGQRDFCKRVFEKIVSSSHFENNQLLQKGSSLLQETKSIGLDKLITDDQQDSFFIIKDAAGNVFGFSAEFFLNLDNGENLNVAAFSYFYLSNGNTYEQKSVLRTDNKFEKVILNTDTIDTQGRRVKNITLTEDNTLEIAELNVGGKRSVYKLISDSIPDALLYFVTKQLLGSRFDQIIVDIIEADGRIFPVLVSKAEPSEIEELVPGAVKVVKIEFVGRWNKPQLLFFDENKKLIKRVLQTQSLVLEPVDLEQIRSNFPERIDYILSGKEKLKQSKVE